MLQDWLEALGIDWNTLGTVVIVYVSVWLAGVSGLAKDGDAKRIAGAVAALAIASVSEVLLDVIPEGLDGYAQLLVAGVVNWLGATLLHLGIDVSKERIANR